MDYSDSLKAPAIKSISILGCGWLGLPFARRLLQEGYQVKGSTTHLQKIEQLQRDGVESFLLKAEPLLEGPRQEEFFDTDCLFITIPYKRDLKDPRYYKEQISSIVSKAKESSVKKIIFSSSTSVYPDNAGVVTEDSPFSSDNERAKVLLEVEDICRAFGEAIIVRFAGLVGNERKIGKFLSGKMDIPDGDSPVNLIHLEDCIEILLLLIKGSYGSQTFNACADEHPFKKMLYTQAAKKAGLPPPEFLPASVQKTKIVSNQKLKEVLKYRFRYPNPMTFP